MYWRISNSWLKHVDFMVFDLIIVEISFALAVMVRFGFKDIYKINLYREMSIVLFLVTVCVIFLTGNYRSILNRGYLKELKATAGQVGYVTACEGLYLFLTKQSDDFSRISFFCFILFYFLLLYLMRCIWKWYLKNYGGGFDSRRAVLVIVSSDLAEDMAKHIEKNCRKSMRVIGFGIVETKNQKEKAGIYPVVAAGKEKILEYIQNHWVDEVLVKISRKAAYPNELVRICGEMGVTVHRCLNIPENIHDTQILEKICGYPVLTTCIRAATPRQAFLKRSMDILGGIIGTLFTGIMFVFIGPMIFLASPGPVFFSQDRIGKGGKKFRIYKFRSMYMDAEKRKRELMETNKIEGHMFKLDADPRIIGSGPDGAKHGLGWFIRKTSLDEFPQFWNVLKGEMSLVGTRPPTVDEWEKYDFHHRARMATKPGITGLWQVSGRSRITDFEKVVQLDMEYIQNWTLGEDIKILFKTFAAVLRGDGAM